MTGQDGRQNIRRIPSDLLASNMYLVEERGHGIVVDPCEDLSPYDPALVYDWIFLTHEHYDHISGVDAWRERTGARVICSRACGESLKDPKKNFSHFFDSFCELQTWLPYTPGREYPAFSTHADVVFDGELTMEWQGHSILLTETPGHSPGGSCLLLDGTSLFAGDCLIPGRKTELRFPGGSRKQWQERTLPFLRSLSPETMVYPGHFAPCALNEFSEYIF